jgi:hypothetical protein
MTEPIVDLNNLDQIMTSVQDILQRIEMMRDRHIPLDITQFFELRAYFFQLNQGYRRLVNEYQKLKTDVADFTKLENLGEVLEPLEENWHAWRRAAEICGEISFIPSQVDMDTEMTD